MRGRRAAALLLGVGLLAGCSGSEGAPSAGGEPAVSGSASADASGRATASDTAVAPDLSASEPSGASEASEVPATAGASESDGATPSGPTASATPSADGAALEPAAGLPTGSKVRRTLFGTHVGRIAEGGGPLPPRAGAIRLWDAGVAWRELEPAKGRVNWSAMDRAVARAEATGARDILWVHGSPPRWAAKKPNSAGLYGPGTSSAPKQDAYLSILKRVAQRYKGRITSYQVWNEANISIFYQGKADYLAELTRRAQSVLAKADPKALLVGASTTIRSYGPVKKWYGKYTAALAERGWPVDAMAVHLYPLADQGPDERANYIRFMRKWLAQRGWTGPVWDTEINYGDRRDFAKEKVAVGQGTASAWVARTYLDSLALGIDRVYWYAWNDHILGIDQVTPGRGAVLPAGRSFVTVQQWLVGATWQGCTGELMAPTGKRGRVTTCALTDGAGEPAQILFTHRGTAKVERPAGATRICTLDGDCTVAKGKTIKVGRAPVLVGR